MSGLDLELNCGVRAVLSRHWIDLTKTSFFARKGHVRLGGEVKVLGDARKKESTADALKATEAEIRRLRDVQTVSFEFTNWVRDSAGVWICLEKKEEEAVRDPQPEGDPGGNEVRSEERAGSA